MANSFNGTPPNKLTHEEYLKRVEETYGRDHEYEVLTNYIGIDYDMKFKHKICGYVFVKRADRFLHPKNKHGEPCPNCVKNLNKPKLEIKEVNVPSNQLVEKKEINEYIVIGRHPINPQLSIVKHSIDDCGYEYHVKIKDLNSKERYKCPICKMKKEASDFIKKVYELKGSEYTVICEFNLDNVSFKLRHNKCGTEFTTTPNEFLSRKDKCKHPKCSDRANKYNFNDKIFEKYGSEYIALDEYQGSSVKIRFKHNVSHCGKIFENKPKYFLTGKGLCPCRSTSRGESTVSKVLKSYKVDFKREYTFEDCKDVNQLRFDFAIFRDSLILCLIEYDGKQHFEPIEWFGGREAFEATRVRDEIKNNYCKENNIPLLRIPYWEKDNIETLIIEFISKIN
jgi:hypothetical protein